MKKIGIAAIVFSAIFLITAVVGGVLLATQLATLSTDDIAKIETAFKDILDDGSISVNGVNLVFFDTGDSPVFEFEKEVECDLSAEQVEIIEIVGGDISDFDATIVRSADETLRVVFKGESCYEDGAYIDVNNGKAVIRFGDGSLFSVRELEADVVISLPASFNGKFIVSNGVGEYHIITDIDSLVVNDFVGEMEVKGHIGDVAIDHCVGEIEIINSSNFVSDCFINNCVGEIEIILPRDSVLNIEVRDSINTISVKGILQGSDAVTLLVENNIGEVVVRGE